MAVDNTPSICFGLQAVASTSAKPINIYCFFFLFFLSSAKHKLQSHHTLMAVCGPVHTLSVSPCQRGAVSSVTPGLYQTATFAALLLTQHTADCQLAFFFFSILAFQHLIPSQISPPHHHHPLLYCLSECTWGVNISGGVRQTEEEKLGWWGKVKKSGTREINPQYPLPAGYLIASQTSHLQS